MTLIEGVGDEVVQFVIVLIVVLVASLAWWSTNARPDRYQTVLVMRSRSNHPVTVSILTRPNVSNSRSVITPVQPPEPIAASNPVPVSNSSRDSRDNRVIPLQEMDSIVDADMAMLDNNRLHFYRRIDSPQSIQTTRESTNEEAESIEEPEPASNAQIREMDSIVSAMEADVTTGCDFFTRSGETNSKPGVSKPSNIEVDDSTEQDASGDNNPVDAGSSNDESIHRDEKKIVIKLKYLNDTLKEVEGSLDELLKDFKRRHFSAELGAERRVRLIFRGRVLVDEAATLGACGLHHRAVVHCLVHPSRPRNRARPAATQQQPNNQRAATHELVTEGTALERAWDLENILMTLVSVALTVVWFFRCEYSNMFTASASVALFGLTVFYSVAIFGLYLSDTFYADRRPAQPAQPVPNN
ncbi:transmembrane and ubiquitin-like domain-containing protein 1 [Pararge aegeria]|nr:transmembrane and ubiquitin-like domain-containing protein 1 [Pararge aegeria]XP_039750303.1 transmembrane and ubiquitin-like domain-containing protein 1 [Pararge aegeria]XP_039750304.1 transmembrane and ubiquitin-like domain-containing protein 1 [Pararge aegeria]